MLSDLISIFCDWKSFLIEIAEFIFVCGDDKEARHHFIQTLLFSRNFPKWDKNNLITAQTWTIQSNVGKFRIYLSLFLGLHDRVALKHSTYTWSQ